MATIWSFGYTRAMDELNAGHFTSPWSSERGSGDEMAYCNSVSRLPVPDGRHARHHDTGIRPVSNRPSCATRAVLRPG